MSSTRTITVLALNTLLCLIVMWANWISRGVDFSAIVIFLFGGGFLLLLMGVRARLNESGKRLTDPTRPAQISLADLLVVPFFIALVMTIHLTRFPKSLFDWCLPITLLLAGYLLHCQMLAGRRGCTDYALKLLYGMGIFLSSLGWGALFFLFLICELAFVSSDPTNDCSRLVRTLFGFGEFIGDTGPLIPFRLALLGLPVGLIINRSIESRLSPPEWTVTLTLDSDALTSSNTSPLPPPAKSPPPSRAD